MKILTAVAISLYVMSVNPALPQSLETPTTEPLLGGVFIDLTATPVAIIQTAEGGQCTGILVSPTHVLTAAHCIYSDFPTYPLRVAIGGFEYPISAAYYHNMFNPYGTAYNNVPYDLGMIVLSQAVTGITPVPILTQDLVEQGEIAYIYGFGTNELSSFTDSFSLANGKAAEIVVTSATGGRLEFSHLTSGASTCPGDSGGPIIQAMGNYLAVAGVISAGTNATFGGTCYLSNGGSSLGVDLQTVPAQGFLSYFNVYKTTGALVAFNYNIKTILDRLENAKNYRIKKLKREMKSAANEMKKQMALANGDRIIWLKKAIKAAKKGSKRKKRAAVSRKKLSQATMYLNYVLSYWLLP